MEEDQPVKPANILDIVATNQGKRPLTMETPEARSLPLERVVELIADGHVVLDARSSAAFGSGHIPGALNVDVGSSEFEQRVGWVTPDDRRIILVTGDDEAARRAVFKAAFIALDTRIEGYLRGGMEAWIEAGEATVTVPQIDVQTLHDRLSTNGMQVLDVREDDEWNEGHIEGAHCMRYTALVPQLGFPAQLDRLELTPDQEIALICASGHRSSTAISILLRAGYRHLSNVAGGMTAWRRAKLSMVDGEGNVCKI